MRLLAFVTLASTLVSSAYAFCGADPGTKEEVAQFEKEFQSMISSNETLAQIGQGKFLAGRSLNKRATTVTVRWNALYDPQSKEGNYDASIIYQTINVVNNVFGPYGLNFRLDQPPRQIPVQLSFLRGFEVGNANDNYVKRTYNVPQPNVLNIYTVSSTLRGAAGWSSFPKDYQANPSNDGIIYDFHYLPGGSAGSAYNTGKIMAHEVGHWVGLYHTFQDGCVDGNFGGDYVGDTPAEASPASGCPRGRDSCPSAGQDPIQNMMDYSDDTCRQGITNGQYQRMAQQIAQFRGIRI